MKNPNLQLLIMMLVVIFLTSCEQENIFVPSEELIISNTEEPTIDGQILENNALVSDSQHTISLAVLQNEIEVIINDVAHSSGDTYSINIYYRGVLKSTTTTNSLKTMINAPTIWNDNLTVGVEKYASIEKGRLLVATEVLRPPNGK